MKQKLEESSLSLEYPRNSLISKDINLIDDLSQEEDFNFMILILINPYPFSYRVHDIEYFSNSLFGTLLGVFITSHRNHGFHNLDHFFPCNVAIVIQIVNFESLQLVFNHS